MRIIISPAKKMREDVDGMEWRSLPAFLPQTERILGCLRAMNAEELQKLWKCSDSIAQVNVERIRHMDLRRRLTPAILAYEGIQYQYMLPEVFTDREYEYVQEHLRILSGFYGMLRPFDGVTPYRLEMQAALQPDGYRDLYSFWGDALACQLANETDCVINLASKEYSMAVSKHLPAGVRMITCSFGERRADGRIAEKGTLCKMARGEMVRFMAEKRAETPDALKAFDGLGFRYSQEDSRGNFFVFVRQPSEKTA